MPPESATAYGLHANAEVGFKRREAERFCASLLCLQPRESAQEGGLRPEEQARVSRTQCRLILTKTTIIGTSMQALCDPRSTQEFTE